MTLKTALIVDDSKLARVTLKKKLESLGLVVDMVESAGQAYTRLQTDRPDILFMDHLMPDIDGFEATQHIRSVLGFTDLPIVMCTGKDHEGYLEEARAIGANNILSKPPVDEALESIIKQFDTINAAVGSVGAEVVEVLDGMSDFDDVLEVVADTVAVEAEQMAKGPAVEGMTREELQWLIEHAMAATHEAVLREVPELLPAPVVAPTLMQVNELIANAVSAFKRDMLGELTASVTEKVLDKMPVQEVVSQHSEAALDMDSVLSTVTAAVNHQLAVNGSTIKASVVDQVQMQLATIAQQQVKLAMEQEIKRMVAAAVQEEVAARFTGLQQQLDEFEKYSKQAKEPKVSGGGAASEEFARAQNDSIQKDQGLLREQLKRVQLIGFGALAVAVIAVVVALVV